MLDEKPLARQKRPTPDEVQMEIRDHAVEQGRDYQDDEGDPQRALPGDR